MKKRRVITGADNFKDDTALRDSVFPFGRKGLNVTYTEKDAKESYLN